MHQRGAFGPRTNKIPLWNLILWESIKIYANQEKSESCGRPLLSPIQSINNDRRSLTWVLIYGNRRCIQRVSDAYIK